MPNGLVHNAALLGTAVVTAPVVLAVLPPDLSFTLIAGELSGVFLTPDLDQAEIRVKNTGVRALANPFKMAWFMYWFPYGVLIPHRAVWSHLPGVGTMIRAVYCPIALGLWLLGAFSPGQCLAFLVGQVVADTVHWLLDMADKHLFGGAL